jgi:hypothetical protein
MCKASSQKLVQELPIIAAHGTLPFFLKLVIGKIENQV